jgi:hypothetical protein
MAATPQPSDAVDVGKRDMNSTEYVEVAAEGLTWTSEEEKKLVRKIDTYLLPTMWLMYLLSYMDRTKYVPFTFPLICISILIT